MNSLGALLLVALSVALGGCWDSPIHPSEVSLEVVNQYQRGPLYIQVWTNTHPDRAYPALDNELGDQGTGFHCADSEQAYNLRGNYLETIYIEVVLSELEDSIGGPTMGRQVEAMRWDGLRCFEGYTLVVDEAHNVQLYHCLFCRDPQEWAGLEPMPPTPRDFARKGDSSQEASSQNQWAPPVTTSENRD